MKTSIHQTQLKEIIFDEAVSMPSIFVVLPFEPKVMSKQVISDKLKWVLHKSETDLMSQFPRAAVIPAIQKLKKVFESLDYTTLKKSVTIFLSPFIEKVYYLNISVNENVVVSEPFSFRTLLMNKKEEKDYLLLVIDQETARIYHGINYKLSLILFNSLKELGEAKEPSGKSSSTGAHLKISSKTIQAIDQSLSLLQKAYGLPVVAMADEETLGRFGAMSQNTLEILDLVPVIFENATYVQIQEALQPCLSDWQSRKLNYVTKQLEQQLVVGKLAVGIAEVWKAARERKTKVLVLEEDYSYPAYTVEEHKIIYSDIKPINHFYTATDVVDETIEYVLAGGGDVVLVEPGTLKDYLHIALF